MSSARLFEDALCVSDRLRGLFSFRSNTARFVARLFRVGSSLLHACGQCIVSLFRFPGAGGRCLEGRLCPRRVFSGFRQ